MTIISRYTNINKEWLDWYLKRLANEEVLPGSTKIVSDLKKFHSASFTSKDPESDVVATTEYMIET